MKIISTNYYISFMEEIYKKINDTLCEKITWFGECSILSLVYDYLAADGYIISDVLDNDKNKWGKTIQRNWCMPFAFKYIEIPKEAVDYIVAGKTLAELKIISPKEFLHKNGSMDKTLFLTCSYRADEIAEQLRKMGADAAHILILPNESIMWEEVCMYLNTKIENKQELSDGERKKILIKILDQFKHFCEEKGLRYYLGYGTLIGAARHQGFIPWDDDIDILMPVEDYMRFLEEYPNNRRYEVLDISAQDEYFFPFAKFVDNETWLHHYEVPITWLQGVYIDIFPMSGFEQIGSFEEQWLKQTLLDIEWYWYYVSKDVIRKKTPDCRKRILNEKFRNPFDKAGQIGVLTTVPAKPWILDKSVFGKGCELNFEGRMYKAPINYDQYLNAVYGDYMQVPPVEEQRVHGFPAYVRRGKR